MVIRPILKRDSVKSINTFLQILSIKRRTAIAIASTTMTFLVNRVYNNKRQGEEL